MTADQKMRALRLYVVLLMLNSAGKTALQRAIERQNPHHGHDTLNALIATLAAYLQREDGE